MDTTLRPELLTDDAPTDVVLPKNRLEVTATRTLTDCVESYLRVWGVRDSEKLHDLIQRIVALSPPDTDPDRTQEASTVMLVQAQIDAWLQSCLKITDSVNDPLMIQRIAAARVALGELRERPDFSQQMLAVHPSTEFIAALRQAAALDTIPLAATPPESPTPMPTQRLAFWPWS